MGAPGHITPENRPELHFAFQIDTTLYRLKSLVIHGLQRPTLSFTRTVVQRGIVIHSWLQSGQQKPLVKIQSAQVVNIRSAATLRKQTVEPVFGIIKSVMGFRQFLLRGLDAVQGEWNLVTMA